jgi:hypothetical protein
MPNERKKRAKADAGNKVKTTKEIEELRQKLSEVREHRDLLIRTLHGFAVNVATTRNLAATTTKTDLDTVLAWLIEKIGKLTVTRPILGMSTLTALRVPVPRLTKEVNSKWFPQGGGFPSIAGSTTVGNLAYAIWQHL